MTPKIFVFGGGNGIYNTGDDAMFEVFVDNLTKYNADINIYTDSSDLEWTPPNSNIKKIIYFEQDSIFARIFSLKKNNRKGIDYYKKSLLNYIKLIKESDVIAFSGAGGLNDRYKNCVLRWGFFITLAKLFNKKVVMSSQGIGPLNKKIPKFFLRSYIKKVDLIEVRDKSSSKFLLTSLGTSDKKIIESPDNAILLKSLNKEQKNTLFKQLDLPEKYIIFSLHKWDKNIDNLFFLKIKLVFLKFFKLGYNIVLLGSKYSKKDDDRKYLKYVFNKLNLKDLILIDKELNSREIKTIIENSSGVISSRYHICLHALATNKICVPICFDDYYKSKMSNLLDWYGLKNQMFYIKKPYNLEPFDIINEKNNERTKKSLIVINRSLIKLKRKSLEDLYKNSF